MPPLSPSDARRLIDDPAAATVWGRESGLADPTIAHRALAGFAEQGLTFDLIAAVATHLASILPEVSDPDRVLVSLERFFTAVRSPLSAGTLFQRNPESLTILARLFSSSPYLADLVITDPEAWEEIRLGGGRPEKKEALAAALAGEMGRLEDDAAVLAALRRFKRRQTLRIAYGDIVGGQRLETVVAQISHVADCIVAAALQAAVAGVGRQRGTPLDHDGRPATIAVFALGKLGGGELNYSSDIDLVFVCSGDGRVVGPKPCSALEFFERVVQETLRLLTETTPLGSAYRVDLRLRPHGTNGPVLMPADQLLQYYDQAGRTWERQAWVKARCVAGDAALGSRLLAELEPWIYRLWLSAADISGIKSLKRRIEQRASRAGDDGRDVKHGRGGIRDVEFTIQFLQLLNGGATPRVRTGNTLEAIRRLAETGSLTDQERSILERTYTLLRTIEHRLQILYDVQTHRLPPTALERRRLAIRTGFGPGEAGRTALEEAFGEATSLNRKILDHLLHDAFPDDTQPEPEVDLILDPEPDEADVQKVLAEHGFRDIPAARRILVSLGEERVRFLSTRRCRHFLAAIASRLLTAIGRTPDPDATLANLDAVADSLGGKGVLWELFSFSPPALDLTVRLCSSSPFLARLLVSNPGMLDELLDSLLIEHLPSPESLDASLAELCRGAVDIQPILHAFKASQQLRVGIRDILGRLETAQISAALTAIAEATVRAVVAHEEAKLVERLGEPMAGQGETVGVRAGPVMLALGKFGGREMNYASDIDIIFLYDHDGLSFHTRRTRRSTEATTNAHFFGELAQRTMRVFNTFTPQGRLYEMDSRLRPSGRSGPAAISLDDFERYFAEDGPAAVWERQALVKARVVVGAKPAADRVRRIISRATYDRPWSTEEIHAIHDMRYRMEEGAKPTNLKRAPGGVVDIEFIAQVLQLVHGGTVPRLRTTETQAALQALHELGHLTDARFDALSRSYRTLRLIEGRLRLLDATARHDFPADPDEQRKLAHLLGYGDAAALSADVQTITSRTRSEFEAVFREKQREK
jgi:[glutamine synthetase] adenylyltransferase / [glutamine synthetase]-adenylyl-L-tyrosine phosphorylase